MQNPHLQTRRQTKTIQGHSVPYEVIEVALALKAPAWMRCPPGTLGWRCGTRSPARTGGRRTASSGARFMQSSRAPGEAPVWLLHPVLLWGTHPACRLAAVLSPTPPPTGLHTTRPDHTGSPGPDSPILLLLAITGRGTWYSPRTPTPATSGGSCRAVAIHKGVSNLTSIY